MPTEKENWLDLAKAQNPESRKLALEMIPWLSKDIQEELFIWYYYNFDSRILKIIFQFLNEDYQKRIKLKVLFDEDYKREPIPERLIIDELIKSCVLDEHFEQSNRLQLVSEHFFASGRVSLLESKSAIDILFIHKGYEINDGDPDG